MRVTIKVDYENAAERWWDAARAQADCPIVLYGIVHGDLDEIDLPVYSPMEYDLAFKWASALPGWSDGPAHARNPLIFVADHTES